MMRFITYITIKCISNCILPLFIGIVVISNGISVQMARAPVSLRVPVSLREYSTRTKNTIQLPLSIALTGVLLLPTKTSALDIDVAFDGFAQLKYLNSNQTGIVEQETENPSLSEFVNQSKQDDDGGRAFHLYMYTLSLISIPF